MECTAALRCGAMDMSRASARSTRFMMGARRSLLSAKRISTRLGAVSRGNRHKIKQSDEGNFSYGPGEHSDYWRGRDRLRYCACGFATVGRRVSSGTEPQAGHGYQHAEQRSDSFGHLLSAEFAEGAAVPRGPALDV